MTGFGALAAEDAAFVARLREGDARAFETLVRTQVGRMLAVAKRLLHSEDDARDVVQDAFLAAFRNVARFEGQSKLETWLHRIVVNAALMRIRSRARRPEESLEPLLPRFLEDGHLADRVAPWSEETQDVFAREERRALVRRAIDALPEVHRAVLVLRDLEEYDPQAAGELLGISANAVNIRLHRARQALRALLDPQLREGAPR